MPMGDIGAPEEHQQRRSLRYPKKLQSNNEQRITNNDLFFVSFALNRGKQGKSVIRT
jgi:hypothetical protein